MLGRRTRVLEMSGAKPLATFLITGAGLVEE